MLLPVEFKVFDHDASHMKMDRGTEFFEGLHCDATLFMGRHDSEFWKSMNETEDFLISYAASPEFGVYFTPLSFSSTLEMHSDYKSLPMVCKINPNDGTYLTYNDVHQAGFDYDRFVCCISPYGVCDNVEQVKNHLGAFLTNDTPVLVTLTPMRKADQPESDGWRWHKWGSYIGVQSPQCEYLADEPEIETVYVFHIHLLQEK